MSTHLNHPSHLINILKAANAKFIHLRGAENLTSTRPLLFAEPITPYHVPKIKQRMDK